VNENDMTQAGDFFPSKWTIRDHGISVDTEFDLSTEPRVKTSLRMHYEAQAEVVRKQVGDLEEIRGKLGLSQRKICQLLMVDPSAWSRWTKRGSEAAPPHIYRALHWYLILQEKIPGLTPQYFIGKDPEVLHQAALREIRNESQARGEFEKKLETLLRGRIQELEAKNQNLSDIKSELEMRISGLQGQVQSNRAGFYLLVVAVLVLSVSFFIVFRK
jgi:transcriptional regulator with XRE-family HTH domain